MIDLTRLAWAQYNPTFRQLFTARFIPGGTHEQRDWFNEAAGAWAAFDETGAAYVERIRGTGRLARLHGNR